MPPDSPLTPTLRLRLPRSVAEAREIAHRARVEELVNDWLERSSRGVKHPVWDFLFTYYSFPPRKLTTWRPAIWEALEAPTESDEEEWLEFEWPALKPRDVDRARWVAELCGAILSRPPRFACHGWHEWAMVYRQSAEEVRHRGYELRLSPHELASLLESQTISCSHYDAFRFFTPEARPMNVQEPTLETRQQMEQGGCLHANMDLYKWSQKLWPWIGSDLVGESFALAAEGRVLDMRASPYDLRELGFEPIPMETEEGREEYRAAQQALAAKAMPLRRKLELACRRLIEVGTGQCSSAEASRFIGAPGT